MSCQCEKNFIPKPGNNKKLRRLSESKQALQDEEALASGVKQ